MRNMGWGEPAGTLLQGTRSDVCAVAPAAASPGGNATGMEQYRSASPGAPPCSVVTSSPCSLEPEPLCRTAGNCIQ